MSSSWLIWLAFKNWPIDCPPVWLDSEASRWLGTHAASLGQGVSCFPDNGKWRTIVQTRRTRPGVLKCSTKPHLWPPLQCFASAMAAECLPTQVTSTWTSSRISSPRPGCSDPPRVAATVGQIHIDRMWPQHAKQRCLLRFYKQNKRSSAQGNYKCDVLGVFALVIKFNCTRRWNTQKNNEFEDGGKFWIFQLVGPQYRYVLKKSYSNFNDRLKTAISCAYWRWLPPVPNS